MNQIVVNEPNKWRLDTPGSACWRPSPRLGAARKNFMMSADATPTANRWAERTRWEATNRRAARPAVID